MKIIHVLLFLAIPSLYAQNSLTGTVTDSTAHAPIVYAAIYLPQLEKGTMSDAQGNYSIHNLPNGTYKIVVSVMGYETFSQNVQLPRHSPLSIALKPSAIEMEEIIVSTPFHKLQSDNVMKVEQESVNNLKSGGALTLADGISSITGVESMTTGMGIGKPVIRGLSSNRVLVYTQGVRLENQQFGDEHGLGVNDAGIESVEVIKGPASLLYGSDALGGVLYLNPEKFAEENTTQGDIGGHYFSNTRGYSTNVGVKTSGEKFKFLFRGSLAEHSDYNTQLYRVTNTRFSEQDFKAGIGFRDKKFKSELRYNGNRSKPGIPGEMGIQSTARTPLLPYQDITNHVLSSRSTVFFGTSSLDVNIGLLYNDRKEFEEAHHHEDLEEGHHHDDDGLHPALQMKLKTLNYDLKYHLPKMGKFETIVGMQGMDQTNTNKGEERLIPDASTNDIGLLATSHIHFESVDIQLGARYDHRSIQVDSGIRRHFNSFNGAFGIKTDVADNLTARLNVATGFRAPNLAELTSDGAHHGTNRYEIGNPDLEHERNLQVDVVLEYGNDHVEVFANGFYNLVDHYIYLSPNGETINGTPAYQYLQNDARLYGGEVGFHFHPHPLDWLHIQSRFETVTGKQEDHSYLPLIPANSLNNTLRVELDVKPIQKAYVFVTLKSTFKQRRISQFESPTNTYDLLSAGIGGRIKLFKNELAIALSGTNLTDKQYISHLSRLKPEGLFNIGRNFNVGLTYYL